MSAQKSMIPAIKFGSGVTIAQHLAMQRPDSTISECA
jgi:hypothetical protein